MEHGGIYVESRRSQTGSRVAVLSCKLLLLVLVETWLVHSPMLNVLHGMDISLEMGGPSHFTEGKRATVGFCQR